MQASSLNSAVTDYDHRHDEKTPNNPLRQQPSHAESLLSQESCTTTGTPNRVLDMTQIEQQVQEVQILVYRWFAASFKLS